MNFGVKTSDNTVQINKKVTKIGRHTANDIVLNSLKVTRYHAEIRLIENRIFIVDNNTLNGTFLEDTKILPDRELLLKIGDTIGVGCKVTEDNSHNLKIVEYRAKDVGTNENNASDSKEFSRQPINVNFNVFLNNPSKKAPNELQQVIAPTNLDSTASSSSLVSTLLPKINSVISSFGIIDQEQEKCQSESSTPIIITETISLADETNFVHPSTNRAQNNHCSNLNDGTDKNERKVKHSHNASEPTDPKSVSSDPTICPKRVEVSRTEVESSTARIESVKQIPRKAAFYTVTESSKSAVESYSAQATSSTSSVAEKSKLRAKTNEVHFPVSSKSRKRCSDSLPAEQNDLDIPHKALKIEQSSVITISDSEEDNLISEEENLNLEEYSELISAGYVLTNSHENIMNTSSLHESSVDGQKNSLNTFSDLSDHDYAKLRKTNSVYCGESINLMEDKETEIDAKKTPTRSSSEHTNDRVPSVNVEPPFSDKLTNKGTISKTLTESKTIDRDHEPISTKVESLLGRNIIDLSSESSEEQEFKPLLPLNVNYSNTDEIITLDSDDEDFPMSQFNASCVDDVPDFSSDLQKIYDYPLSDDESDKPAIKLECGDSLWFEPVTQNDLVEGKRVFENDRSGTDEGPPKLSDVNEDPYKFLESDEQSDTPAEGDEKCAALFEESERPSVLSREHKRTFTSCKHKLLSTSKKETSCVKELTDAEIERKYSLKPLSVKLPRISKYEIETRMVSNDHVEKIVKKVHQEKSQLKKKTEGIRAHAPKLSVLLKYPQDKPKPIHSKKQAPSTILEIRRNKDIKKKRKEKLKKIACKETSEKSDSKIVSKSETKSVVAKITQTNRNTKLAEALLSTQPSVKGNEKGNAAKLNGIERQISEIHENIETPLCLKGLNEKLKTKALKVSKVMPVTPCNDSDLIDEIIKRHCPVNKVPSSAAIDPTSGDNNNEGTKPKLFVQKSVPQLKMSKKFDSSSTVESNISCINNTTNSGRLVDKPPDKPTEMRPKKAEIKSILKKNKTNYLVGRDNLLKKIKKVKLNVCLNDYKYFEMDREERRNNGTFAPTFKLNEQLIRESVQEFEAAITKVCSWNVRWLEEQQKNMEPPPLYPEGKQNGNTADSCKQYKEHLKRIMFNSLWKSMFRAWNKPDNDFLPHTQFITEKQSNTCVLKIETVDDQKVGELLWTICASRLLTSSNNEDEALKGQIVILNFYVKRTVDKEPKKTMVFAYVANVVKINCDGRFIQRMWFRIYAKPFKIEPGVVKVKILSYLKSHLRPFQALAMVTRSPLTNIIIDSSAILPVEPVFESGEDAFSDKFLDASQRKAIASCLNSIFSAKPSICLIDGAAGTGKTQVIVSLLKELFSKNTRSRFPDDLKILIVTTSDNVADDVSYRVEAINKREKCMHLLRYGNCKGMHFSMKKCTLDKQVEDLVKEDNGQNLINLPEEINNLRAKINSFKLVLESQSAKSEKISEASFKLTAGDGELKEMESENSRVIEQRKSNVAREIIIENADVVVTSMSSCWSSSFENDFIPTNANKGDIHKFTVCIFDDANDITEIGVLVPIMLMVRSLILIGDRRNCRLMDEPKWPFFRLLRNAPNTVVELNQEYRMHPSVMQWVDKCFLLKCEEKNIPPIHKSIIVPFVVINIPFDQGIDESEKYEEQAAFCARLIEKLDRLAEPKLKFGVIISHESENQKEIIRSSLPQSIAEKGRKIVIDQLEEFCGREQDVVIVCMPYKYPCYYWLYVAVTRAKSSLIVCGDFSHIQNSTCVDSLVSYAKRRSIYVSVNPKDNIHSDYLVKNQKTI